MNGVKLIYKVADSEYPPQVLTFNTKKAAQMADRFLKEEYGDAMLLSKIIYDDDIEYV